MKTKILLMISVVSISLFTTTSIFSDKVEKKNETKKTELKKNKDCKKACGKQLNECNTKTSKIDKKEKEKRKASHNACQQDFTSCKEACK